MSSATVKVVGVEKLLKKLDMQTIVEPERKQLLATAASQTKSSLGPTLPRRSGASASQLTARLRNSESWSVDVPRVPFIFLEAGSQYHEGAGPRKHVRKTAAQRRAGRYRIKPMRFMSRERARVRKRLAELILRMKQDIEKQWDK